MNSSSCSLVESEKNNPILVKTTLIQWEDGWVSVSLPAGGYEKISSFCSTPIQTAGFCMIASLMYSSKYNAPKTGRSIMYLVKDAARQFVSPKKNPATTLAKDIWGCEQAVWGCNRGRKTCNRWFAPPWFNGRTQKHKIRVTHRQFEIWNRRSEIVQGVSEQHNPHLKVVRRNLHRITPGPRFDEAMDRLTQGQRDAVNLYLENPSESGVTQDGDIHSNLSRIPESMRAHLQIENHPVLELDVKSAHAELLGMFYNEELGRDWEHERNRFIKESLNGFRSIYGSEKEWKKNVLAALNMPTGAARATSPGYKAFESLFPLLASKVGRLKVKDSKTVGRILRGALARIQHDLILENEKDSIPSIPVVDSVVIPSSPDLQEQHRMTFRTAWRLGVPIGKLTGTSPLIEGSNEENYRFFV